MAKDRATRKRAEPDVVLYLWPCNVTAWQCWCAVQTQWRFSEGKRTGLDYAGVMSWLTTGAGLRGTERKEVFSGVCAAERASLDAWAEIAAKRQSQT